MQLSYVTELCQTFAFEEVVQDHTEGVHTYVHATVRLACIKWWPFYITTSNLSCGNNCITVKIAITHALYFIIAENSTCSMSITLKLNAMKLTC